MPLEKTRMTMTVDSMRDDRFSGRLLFGHVGRNNAYFGYVYMTFGFAFYVAIISIYGGGFSIVPAYPWDVFDTRHAGVLHGMLFTARSAAGVAGPVPINYIREYNVRHCMPKAQADFCVKAFDKRRHVKSEVDAEIEPARAQTAAEQAWSGLGRTRESHR